VCWQKAVFRRTAMWENSSKFAKDTQDKAQKNCNKHCGAPKFEFGAEIKLANHRIGVVSTLALQRKTGIILYYMK